VAHGKPLASDYGKEQEASITIWT